MGEARRKRLLGLTSLSPSYDDSGQTCDTEASSVIRSLAAAQRRGQVHRFIERTHVRQRMVAMPAEDYHWERLPVFDFGHLQDPGHADFVGQSFTGGIADECYKLANDLLHSGHFKLRFPECQYIFRYAESTTQYETIKLLHLTEDDGEISCDTYFRQFNAPRADMRRWGINPFQFTLFNGKGAMSSYYDKALTVDAHYSNEIELDLRSTFTEMFVCTVLLLQPQGSVTTSLTAATPIRGTDPDGERGTDDQSAEPEVRMVRINRAAVAAHLGEMTFDRTSRRPHERRGHLRKLRDGRTVPVRASKIHGGSDCPPIYRVVE